MLYARSDVMSVVVPNGCGKTHTRPINKSTKQPEADFILKCAPCESQLVDDPRWVSNRDKLPLTPDEELKKERAKEEGSVSTQLLMKAMGEALANIIAKNPSDASKALQNLQVIRPS